jgi:hypothetical protein
VKATQEKNAAYQRTIEERCTRARHEEYHNIRHEKKRIHNKKKRKKEYQEKLMKTLERINNVRESRNFTTISKNLKRNLSEG